MANDPVNFVDYDGLRSQGGLWGGIRPGGTFGFNRDLHEALENLNDPRPYWKPIPRKRDPSRGCFCPVFVPKPRSGNECSRDDPYYGEKGLDLTLPSMCSCGN